MTLGPGAALGRVLVPPGREPRRSPIFHRGPASARGPPRRRCCQAPNLRGSCGDAASGATRQVVACQACSCWTRRSGADLPKEVGWRRVVVNRDEPRTGTKKYTKYNLCDVGVPTWSNALKLSEDGWISYRRCVVG